MFTRTGQLQYNLAQLRVAKYINGTSKGDVVTGSVGSSGLMELKGFGAGGGI